MLSLLFRPLFAAATLAALTGCVRPAPAPPSATARADCDTSGVQSYIGHSWRVSDNDALRRASGAQVLRVMWAGEPVTLELDPARLNVVLDRQNSITHLYCG